MFQDKKCAGEKEEKRQIFFYPHEVYNPTETEGQAILYKTLHNWTPYD